MAVLRRLSMRKAAGPRAALIGIVSIDDLTEALALQMHALAGPLRANVEREAEPRPEAAEPTARTVFLPLGTPGVH
ncbi:MAG TPA: hypothetical protein VLJ62_13750 [Burkholderiaceae bacterium]|nr:hypothetical protein [Burkholderiaceae bacterium]